MIDRLYGMACVRTINYGDQTDDDDPVYDRVFSFLPA